LDVLLLMEMVQVAQVMLIVCLRLLLLLLRLLLVVVLVVVLAVVVLICRHRLVMRVVVMGRRGCRGRSVCVGVSGCCCRRGRRRCCGRSSGSVT